MRKGFAVLTLRLMDAEELDGVTDPQRCVELAVPRRVEDTVAGDMITIRTLRMTPSDLVRLHAESGDLLDEFRAMVEKEAALWERARRRHAAQAPEIGLLQRVLEGLRTIL